MRLLKRKSLIVIIVIAILGMLMGSTGMYLLLRKDLNKPLQLTAQEKVNIEQNNTSPLEETLPPGTISPTSIVNDTNKYLGKEQKIRGRVVEKTDGKYILAGQEKSGASAVSIDLSKAKNVEISKFISGYTDPKKSTPQQGKPSPASIGAVTVTGIVNIQNQELTVSATSIDF